MKYELRKVGRLLGVALISYFVFGHSYFAFAGGAGTEAGDFLRIGASGRQAAMGDSTVSLADDANAALWNPAAWGRLRRHEAALLRTEWVEQITYTGAVYGHSTESWGNWGVGALWLDYPDIQGFDAAGTPQASLKAGNQVFLAGHGRSFGPVSVGGNVKHVKETLDRRSASAWAGDLGAHWKTVFDSGQKLHLGAALRNAGGKIQFIEKSAPLPASIDVGVGYQALNDSLSFGADASFTETRGTELRLGAEYWIRNILAVRAGFKPGEDLGNGLTFGFGAHVKRIYFDYAFVDLGRLEGTHRLSFRMRFGGVMAKTYQKALRLAKEERYVQALDQLDTVIREEPTNAEALSQLRSIKQIHEARTAPAGQPENAYDEAQALFRQKRYLSALDKFMEALAENPEKEQEIRRSVAIIGAEMQGEEALSSQERDELSRILRDKEPAVSPAQAAAGETEEEALGTARGLYKRERYLSAHDLLADLQKNAPDPAVRDEARQLLAKVMEVMAERARKADSADPRYNYSVGFLSHVNRRPDQAIAYWKRVLDLTPDNDEVRKYMEATQQQMSAQARDERVRRLTETGISHYRAGRFDLAQEVWRQAAQMDPDNAELQSYLRSAQAKLVEKDRDAHTREQMEKAKLYYEVGQWRRAVETLENMAKLHPLNAEARQLLANAREQVRLVKERAQQQQKPAPKPAPAAKAEPERNPAKALALYQRGLIAYAQGNVSEAINLWEEATGYDPSFERVKKSLERAYLDQQYEQR